MYVSVSVSVNSVRDPNPALSPGPIHVGSLAWHPSAKTTPNETKTLQDQHCRLHRMGTSAKF